MMKARKIILICPVILLLLILLFHSMILTQIANYLMAKDPIEKADIILVLSGDASGGRTAQGVELFKQGYADRVVMIGGMIMWNTYEPDIMKKHAVYLGVPGEKILVVNQGESTVAQAKKMIDEMKINGFKSAIVVTSDFHTRRTRYIFRKLFSPSNLNVTVIPTTSIYYNSSDWWNNSQSAEIVFFEYTKLFYYLLRY